MDQIGLPVLLGLHSQLNPRRRQQFLCRLYSFGDCGTAEAMRELDYHLAECGVGFVAVTARNKAAVSLSSAKGNSWRRASDE